MSVFKSSKRRSGREASSQSDTGINRLPTTRTTRDGSSCPTLVRTLSTIAEHAKQGAAIRREDLSAGDQVVVRTRNSVYSMWALGDDEFAVSGGWFDQNNMSPVTIRINGCTYGQSAIRHDVVAAQGLFLEFGNNVRTTRIQDVRLVRSADQTTAQLAVH